MSTTFKKSWVYGTFFLLAYTFTCVKYLFILEKYSIILYSIIFILIFISSLTDKNAITFFNKNKSIFIIVLFGFLYIYILGGIKNVITGEYLVFYRRMMSPLIFYICLSISTLRQSKNFWIYFFYLIVIELFIGFLQYEGMFEKNPYGLSNVNFSGTFLNNNSLGNLFSIIGILGFYEFVLHKNDKKKYFNIYHGVLQVLVLFGIVASGVRTSIIIYFLGFFIIYFFIGRNRLKYNIIQILMYSVAAIISLNILNILIPESISRIINGYLQVISVNDFYNSYSTLAISYRLFESGFNDILFGEWRLFSEGYYVIMSGNTYIPIRDNTNNFTDATLLVIVKEFGLIGVFFFFFPYIIIFLNNNKSLINGTLLLFLLIMTITDLGIFDPLIMGCVFWYMNTDLYRGEVTGILPSAFARYVK